MLFKNTLIRAMLVSTLLTPVAGLAASLQSKIDAVTLFPDGALITRKAKIELAAGSHTLSFDDLPASMDPSSLRISGEGSAEFRLGAFEVAKNDTPTREDTDRAARRRALVAEIDGLKDRIDAGEGRKAMIRRFADAKGEVKISAAEIEASIRAAELVQKGLLTVNEELRALAGTLTQREEALAALDAASESQPPALRQVMRLPVELASPARGELTIQYRVSNANWRPVYDARLETRGGKAMLSFTRRALVKQSTGEAWSDARLTLSTTRTRIGTAAPDLRPERVEFVPPPRPMPMARADIQALAMADAKQRARHGAPAMVAAEEAVATLEASPFQSAFVIPGRTSLASGGEEKNLLLDEEIIEPNLNHRAVPLLDAAAYLEVRMSPMRDVPLLAGEVTLHRDGMIIGRTRLVHRVPGEAFSLGFGVDERVSIRRVPVMREAREPGLLGSTRSQETRFRIEVKNKHAFEIALTLEDRLPISEDNAIEVLRLPDMTKPSHETVDDRRGVFSWVLPLKSSESRVLTTGYLLRWPQGREIRMVPLRN